MKIRKIKHINIMMIKSIKYLKNLILHYIYIIYNYFRINQDKIYLYYNYIVNGILIFLVFLIFSYYIWVRFIREHLPKNVPFEHFSFLGFIFILYVCSIYLFIIYKLVNTNYEINVLFNKLINLFYMPLEKFDEFFKSFKPINTIYRRFLVQLVFLLPPYVITTQIFYYFLVVIPRIILVVVLCIDTFYFHHFYTIYQIVLLGFLIFLRKYFKYSLKSTKNIFLNELDLLTYVTVESDEGRDILIQREDFDWHDTKYADYFGGDYMTWVSLEEYVNYQTQHIFFNNGNRCYVAVFSRKRTDRKTKEHYYTIENDDGTETRYLWPEGVTRDTLKKRLDNILQISVILYYIENTHNDDDEVKDLKVLIFINYFLCWFYILITSIPNLEYFPKELLKIQEYLDIFFRI